MTRLSLSQSDHYEAVRAWTYQRRQREIAAERREFALLRYDGPFRATLRARRAAGRVEA